LLSVRDVDRCVAIGIPIDHPLEPEIDERRVIDELTGVTATSDGAALTAS
jgi:hypothetical protein